MACTTLFALCTFVAVAFGTTSREEEFSRIKQYELIQIDTDSLSSSNVIRFDAFGHHYDVELVPNADMVASEIRHNLDPLDHADDPFFTSLTTSCHYFGRVLGVDSSKVALSICSKRGIRGSVTAFNETVVIKPAAFYLDFEGSLERGHHESDEHLVYRQSDFDLTDIGRAETIGTIGSIDSNSLSLAKDEAGRRRMAQNGGNSLVEMMIINGPIRTQNYQSSYGMHCAVC
mgnify:CR=1 FL=1